jgi:D-arabinose 1-dehydrogenase-like Zn-dependent alcohol dehydrogenase
VGSRANTKQELQETMDLVAQGRLVPVVDRIVPFDDVESAFAALREKRASGRNVLSIG